MAPPYLSLQSVSKRYGNATVVDAVSLEAEASRFVCVLGPSGCGKTTLLRMIAGFERSDAGRIIQAGRNITDLPPEARDYGIVFQSYALFPNRTVAGNIAFGLEATGTPRNLRHMKVTELLTLVGLGEHADKYPNQISGGQQQRVALARALALSPGLLLLDEPLSALDANVRANLRAELKALQKRVGVTAVMVTHDREEAFSVADQIVIMNKGRIEQSGPPEDVYKKPVNLFVARLLGGCNALPLDQFGAGNAVAVHQPSGIGPGGTYACIRPGAVLIGAEAERCGNAFPARLLSVTFLGEIVRLHVAPVNSPAVTIEAEVLQARVDHLPARGEIISIALPEKHLMFLQDAA
ncbi:MAG: ATP-binding cassette domain-containing protein [Verrucomicrobiaceae bacterium]